MDNKKCVQVKFKQYFYKYQDKFLTVPEHNFLFKTVYGILRSKHIHLNKIGSTLQEDIILKKTCKRLSYHLGKADLYDRLNDSHLEANIWHLSRCRYLIVDSSDVTKKYAENMEGIARVKDGSTGKIENGYWQTNLICINPSSSSTVLASSRLYSYKTDKESAQISENNIILDEISRLDRVLKFKQTLVIDKGGDRRKLIERFLKEDRPFIIHQTGKRHVVHAGKKKSVSTLRKKTDLTYTVTVTSKKSGRKVMHTFHCGAIRVFFPFAQQEGHFKEPLWLVSIQRRGKGRCSFLCSINAETEKEAIEIMMEGYGARWKIEEVHRQVKQDYSYEKIALRRYVALRNFNVIFWIAMGFLYQQLEDVSLKLIMAHKEKLVYTGKLKDIGDFHYYKLSKLVSSVFSSGRIRWPANKPKKCNNQLALALE